MSASPVCACAVRASGVRVGWPASCGISCGWMTSTPRLPDSRKGTHWRNVLKTLVAYRLIDPGSEWRLHRQWFEQSAMAEGFDHEAEPFQRRGLRQHPVRIHRVEVDHFGDQQQLPGDARRGALTLEALVDQALVSRMLIDDDDAVLGLCDDIGTMQLRAGGAQRRLPGLGLALMGCSAAVGGRNRQIGQARLPVREAGRRRRGSLRRIERRLPIGEGAGGPDRMRAVRVGWAHGQRALRAQALQRARAAGG